MDVLEVVGYPVDIDFHFATWIELDTKIFEEFIVSSARGGLVVDLVGRFCDIDDGEVLHTEGDTKAETFVGIDFHRPGREEGGSNLD